MYFVDFIILYIYMEAPGIVNEEKRKKRISRFNWELANILEHSHNPEDIAKNFDRIFSDIKRLISYLTKNGEKKLNKELQATFFKDICEFINKLDGNDYFTWILNSFPKTSIWEYNKKTIWNQFSQLLWWRQRNKDLMPEWWSCHYRTLLLYNFFNKLKDLWLDLEIKFFRYKRPIEEINDEFIEESDDESLKEKYATSHSWLIVTFQWEDYLVDQGDPNLINKEETIIRKIQPYIYKYKKAYFDLLSKRKDNPNIEGFVNTARRFLNFYENLKHGNMKETYMVNFFDKVEDFISHLKDNPAYKTMMFYLQPWELEKWRWKHKNWHWKWSKISPYHIRFEFTEHCIYIRINDQWHWFYLGDNNISEKGFPSNLIDKLTIEKDKNWARKLREENKELIESILPFIFHRTDIKYCDFVHEWTRRQQTLVRCDWKNIINLKKW